MQRILPVMIVLLCMLGSCAKVEDQKAPTSDSLNNNSYCNDPEAVNYNWGFPGKPDNTLCFFPTEVFVGKYLFKDSIYYGQLTPAFELNKDYTINLTTISRSKFNVEGFCTAGGSVRMVADKFYKAVTDSLYVIQDTVKLAGQPLCGGADTLIGSIIRPDRQNDKNIRINFAVYSDTGITYHIGTATKQ